MMSHVGKAQNCVYTDASVPEMYEYKISVVI